jgi:hypothetical protein
MHLGHPRGFGVQLSKQLIVGCFGIGVFACLLLGRAIAPAIPSEVQTTASLSNHQPEPWQGNRQAYLTQTPTTDFPW